jgi:hypothetical protein
MPNLIRSFLRYGRVMLNLSGLHYNTTSHPYDTYYADQ